jgi:O-Antigen ligase/Tetratricopeptide repeat
MVTRAEPVTEEAAGPGPGAAPRRREATLAAALLLGGLSLLWFWWAWRAGAYFGVIFYPGAIALALTLAVLLVFAPWPVSLRSSWGAAVAVVGLTLLGAWTLLSGLWSPAPDEAVSDGARVLLYAVAFLVGVWLCRLLANRATLTLMPVALAGGVAALGTAITLMTGDDFTRYISRDGSLEFPLGYHNANAAFFAIAAWAALALASSPRVDWMLRGPMLGSAVVCADVAFLSQSRGSLVGIAAAAFVWLLVSPYRLRALLWLLLAGAVAAAAIPWLSDVYTTFNAGDPLGPVLDDAGRMMILIAAGATVIGLLVARLEPAPRRAPELGRTLLVPLAAGIAVIVVGVAGAFAVAGEDPVDWVDQRLEQLGESGSPQLSAQQSRFGFNATSQRPDQWGVAWQDYREDPLFGQGAGSFQFTYTRERDADLTARDAHSVEMELLGELGFPAVLMFGAVIVGAAAAALRSRRLGPVPATVSAGALTAGAYWLAHTSLDWFWTYPVVTAPVFALLGAAAAPAVALVRGRMAGGPGRYVAAAAVLFIALATVPFYLSDRYVSDAYREWQADLQGAYDDLDRAATLDPFSDEPALAEGAIAREAGNRARAIKAFRDAIDRTPEEWVSHLYLGELLEQNGDAEAARREFETALELNPRSQAVQQALGEPADES